MEEKYERLNNIITLVVISMTANVNLQQTNAEMHVLICVSKILS